MANVCAFSSGALGDGVSGGRSLSHSGCVALQAALRHLVLAVAVAWIVLLSLSMCALAEVGQSFRVPVEVSERFGRSL